MTTITSVETRFVRLPLAFSYSGGRGAVGGKPMGPPAGQYTGSVIVLLRTDDGLTGFGDVIVKGGDPRVGEGTTLYLKALLANTLIGQSPFDVD
ncbi:MAG: hypothetical protein M3442_03915, partial [Chloroflexota bacterium]|nr:hypothetical protein [Chloroflexota bacterium]